MTWAAAQQDDKNQISEPSGHVTSIKGRTVESPQLATCRQESPRLDAIPLYQVVGSCRWWVLVLDYIGCDPAGSGYMDIEDSSPVQTICNQTEALRYLSMHSRLGGID